MRIAILHDNIPEAARQDELDTLIQANAVSRALSELGHEPSAAPFSLELNAVIEVLHAINPDLVFNLVESVEGRGQLIHLAPALLDHLDLPYTGCPTEAIFLTSNKLVAKKILAASGIATTPWFTLDHPWPRRSAQLSPRVTGRLKDDARTIRRSPAVTRRRATDPSHGQALIVKSVWEHASIGLTRESVIFVEDSRQLRRELIQRRERLGGECFAEIFVEGREFNLSLLASEGAPEVLPPAEIQFVSYPPGTSRIVDYDAKWTAGSFAYDHTPRTFDFSREDEPLLEQLAALARQCWDLFGLRGYARVDFRVDRDGKPWVLEINANPCISPDSGFVAAAQKAGLSFNQTVQRIIHDSVPV